MRGLHVQACQHHIGRCARLISFQPLNNWFKLCGFAASYADCRGCCACTQNQRDHVVLPSLGSELSEDSASVVSSANGMHPHCDGLPAMRDEDASSDYSFKVHYLLDCASLYGGRAHAPCMCAAMGKCLIVVQICTPLQHIASDEDCRCCCTAGMACLSSSICMHNQPVHCRHVASTVQDVYSPVQGLTLEHKVRILRQYHRDIPRGEIVQLLQQNAEDLDTVTSIIVTNQDLAAFKVCPFLHLHCCALSVTSLSLAARSPAMQHLPVT